MPIYEYQCPDCGHRFDAMQKFSDDPIRVCPECAAGNVRKLVSASAFVLKGGGWYKDHYGLKSPAPDAGGKDGGSKDGGSKDGGSKDGGSKEGGSKEGGSKEGGSSAGDGAKGSSSGEGSKGPGSGSGSSGGGTAGGSTPAAGT